MGFYAILFILLFLLFYKLLSYEKPSKITKEDLKTQKELLDNISQIHKENQLDADLEKMGIKSLPRDKNRYN